MIKCNVTNVAITLTETETLTAGRVGLECQFSFSSEWDGLAITAYFLGSTTKAVVVAGDTVTVPAESMAEPGYKLYVGVVGKNAQGNIVIPTLWASAGKIKRSPGEEEEATPSPDVVAQIQLMAMEALEKATYAKGVIDDNLEAITEAGETQTEAVNTEGSTQVQAIQTESSTQQAAIAAAAAAARESIPEDYTALTEEVNDVKSALVQNYASIINVEQGYWAVVDGEPVDSASWCRTNKFINKDSIVKTTTSNMWLVAYNNITGVYVGTWDGTQFSTTYNSGLTIKEFNISEFSKQYSGYMFAIDFKSPSGDIMPSDIYAELTIRSNQSEAIDFIETGKFNLEWVSSKYLNSNSGDLGNASGLAATERYYPVRKGQILKLNLCAVGTNEAAIAWYDESKAYLNRYERFNGIQYIKAPSDGYARFSTRISVVSTTSAYAEIANESVEKAQKYLSANENANVGNETAVEFISKYAKNELLYTGEVTPQKRYLAIGFDDFRASDFESIIPIFNKYRANATFNKVATGNDGTITEQDYIGTVINNCHEIGDHTLLHYAFPYTNANFNGQNPSSADGSQTPYPTNAMMRDDAGSGKNAFGLILTSAVSISGCPVTANWGELTDAQCQTIRDCFSVMKNDTFAPLIDSLSNKYLGTTGTSAGSYDSETGKYTGGIFTGCETSENHEVWERILTIVQMYYKDQFGLAFNFKCWSLPGTNGFNYGLLYDSKKYYDTDHEKLFNMNARFTSSLTGETRSFAEVLEQFGYLYTHDFNYPGRLDGGSEHMINKQFIINANLSRKNGIAYPTNRVVVYSDISSQYPASFFSGNAPKGQQMYEAQGTFKTFIDSLRNVTASGIIRGEVIDSDNSYSMKTWFDELLKFCKVNNIEVITKSQANDICFNHPIRNGNLLYNPNFENSIKKAYPNASNIPSAPDGVAGSCEVVYDSDGTPVLKTTGEVYIDHYGIPTGKLTLKMDVKNNASSQYVIVYSLKNNDPSYRLNDNGHILATAYPDSGTWATVTLTFTIPNANETEFDSVYSGMGDKICGIYLRLSGALEVKNMSLTLN